MTRDALGVILACWVASGNPLALQRAQLLWRQGSEVLRGGEMNGKTGVVGDVHHYEDGCCRRLGRDLMTEALSICMLAMSPDNPTLAAMREAWKREASVWGES